MKEVLTRCGMRCDLCAAWSENVTEKDDRETLSNVWKKYYDLDIPAESIACNGCVGCSGKDAVLLDDTCPVRPCVEAKGLEHCGQCDEYPCATFEQRRGLTMEAAAELAGDAFSKAEYRKYLQANDNTTRLDALRLDANHNQRMTNSLIVPDVTAMVKFIGGEPAGAFSRLARFLFDQKDLKTEIRYGGRNYGWEINARKGGRPVLSLTPIRHGFLVLCVMGRAELEIAGLYRELLSDAAHQLVEDTRQFHDGKWVSLHVESDNRLNDVLGLFAIKRYGLKAREGMMAASQRMEEMEVE